MICLYNYVYIMMCKHIYTEHDIYIYKKYIMIYIYIYIMIYISSDVYAMMYIYNEIHI